MINICLDWRTGTGKEGENNVLPVKDIPTKCRKLKIYKNNNLIIVCLDTETQLHNIVIIIIIILFIIIIIIIIIISTSSSITFFF